MPKKQKLGVSFVFLLGLFSVAAGATRLAMNINVNFLHRKHLDHQPFQLVRTISDAIPTDPGTTAPVLGLRADDVVGKSFDLLLSFFLLLLRLLLLLLISFRHRGLHSLLAACASRGRAVRLQSHHTSPTLPLPLAGWAPEQSPHPAVLVAQLQHACPT